MSTICFDRTAEAKRILKNGIGSTSVRARNELWTAAWYLVNKTTYTNRQVAAKLRAATSDYFLGMPEDYIDASIQDIISSIKHENVLEGAESTPQAVTIYKEELEQIEALGHDDTERLAFVFLCAAKMIPYEQIYECNAELYRLAWKYKYDSNTKTVTGRQKNRRVGGNEPTKRVNRICQAGIVRYSTRINTSYKLTKDKPPAAATFTVPILRDSGEVAFIIEKPDEDSLILYYDRYKGYGGIMDCERCGKPVFRSGRRQKYCSACADLINHHPEKRDLWGMGGLKTPCIARVPAAI